jgi:isochorismate synthase
MTTYFAKRTALADQDPQRWIRLGAQLGIVHADENSIRVGLGELAWGEREGEDLERRTARASSFLAQVTMLDSSEPKNGELRAHLALGFLAATPARLVIPSAQITLGPSGAEIVTLASTEDELHEVLLATLNAYEATDMTDDAPLNDVVSIHDSAENGTYDAMIRDALGLIATTDLEKVVLARRLSVTCATTIDPGLILERMSRREPSCTLYAFPLSAKVRMLGASPELLIERNDNHISSHPLAGTLSLKEPESETSELIKSSKDLAEHQFVVADIEERLAPFVADLQVPATPSIVKLRSVAHLGTRITGMCADRETGPAHVVELLSAIHPTPAIGGVPREGALSVIHADEPFSREFFGGAFGWFDQDGNGEFVLGIRGATIEGSSFSITAGAGVVEGSTPEGEDRETTTKLSSILDAVLPGMSSMLEQIP